MPFVDRGPARIWWNASAPKDTREAVVLVMGLGCSSDMWFRVAPDLSRRFRVILLDNRGVGRTRVNGVAVVHRVDAMADDVAAVLDAADESAAHIGGFSMGGMVAQEFALSHPRRTRSLALMGTHPGATHSVKARDDVLRLLFHKQNQTPQQSLDAMRPHVYADTTPDERIDRDHEVRLDYYPTLRGYQAQLYGLLAWSAYHRLPRITARTLVVHGLDDGLIPPANGCILAERIPNARHEELRNASHWLFTDQTKKTLALLNAFYVGD